MLLVHTTLPPGPRMHPPTTHPALPRHPNDPHPTTPNPDEKGSLNHAACNGAVEPLRQRLRLFLLNEQLERGRGVRVADSHCSPRRSSSTSRDAFPVARLRAAKSTRTDRVTAPLRLRRARGSSGTGASRATGLPLLVIKYPPPERGAESPHCYCAARGAESCLTRDTLVGSGF